jgi:hypothetical protein
MQKYGGSGGTAPSFSTSALDWVYGQLRALAALSPGKQPTALII